MEPEISSFLHTQIGLTMVSYKAMGTASWNSCEDAFRGALQPLNALVVDYFKNPCYEMSSQ